MTALTIYVISEGFPRKPMYCCRAPHPEHQQDVTYKHPELQALKDLINLETKTINEFTLRN